MNQPPRFRQGKPHAFKQFWDEGHDPLKPCIETKDEKGNVVQKNPIGRAINVCDMADEDLADFLGEEERKALVIARQQQKESKGRDMCKEYHEKKEKEKQEEINVLQERNKVLETWARDQEAKQKKMEERMEKMASRIAQLMGK